MKLSTMTILLGLTAFSALAAPICPTTGTYATLQSLGSCTIDNLTFSNFTFAPSATGIGLTPVASQVSYVLDDPSNSTDNGQEIWGFEFNPNVTVSNIGSEDIDIQYLVTAPSLEISSIHLLQTATAQNGATASVTEGPDCGATTIGGPCTFLPTISVTAPDPTAELTAVGPYISLQVFKNIDVTSLTPDGFATISNVRDAIDNGTVGPRTIAPEPVSSFYIGSGGALLFALRKRLRRSS